MKIIICSDCGESKQHYGHGVCHSCYNKRWNATNPHKHREYEAARRAKLGDKYKLMEQERNSSPKRKEWKSNYYATHKEYFAQKQREYRQRHKDKSNERWRQWYEANPDKVKAKSIIADERRRSRINNLPSTLTIEQWLFIKKVYNNRCAYCGKNSQKLTQDHVVPVSKGGGYTIDNIVPACRSCNSKKGNRKPLKPVKLLLL